MSDYLTLINIINIKLLYCFSMVVTKKKTKKKKKTHAVTSKHLYSIMKHENNSFHLESNNVLDNQYDGAVSLVIL